MKTKLVFDFNLREKEAAAVIGVCPRTISNYRTSGTIPDYCYRQMGRTYRYCGDLLRKWQATPASERPIEEIKIRELIRQSLKF